MLYNIDAVATPLPSERDQNFLLTTPDGARTVLKIANRGDDRALLEAQNAAMTHVAERGVAFCPRVVSTISGETIATTDDGAHFVRCVTYLPGIPLAQAPSPFEPGDLFVNLGRAVGALDAALAEFDHGALHRDFYWDLANAERVIAEYLPLLPSRKQQAINHLSATSLSWVERHRPALRFQTVHHDANDWNVLVEGSRISGIIDFGDMVHSWTVADPAVAIAYAILDSSDPLAIAAHVAAGYNERYPLRDAEIATAFPFATLRLCMSACIAASQQRQRPDDVYLAVSQAPISRTLSRLAEISPSAAEEQLRRACR